MNISELENLRLLREAAEIASSVSAKVDACYAAHCKTTGYSEKEAA